MEKIKAYPAGFTFKLDFSSIPKPQANALKIVINVAHDKGLLETVELELNLFGELVCETFKRTEFEQ